jgi:PPP family 3-phenylpropionic acid transporter
MPLSRDQGQPAVLSDAERLSYTVRLALVYAALFLLYGVHLPYLPVWLHWRGLDAQQIAIITAAPLFLRVLVTPALAVLADQYGNHRAMVQRLCWLTLALAIVMSQMQGFWPILFVAIPFAMAMSTIMPLTETIAITGVRTAGLDYGRMRLWGSLTFVLAGLIGGTAIDWAGPVAVAWCFVASAGLLALAANVLPRPASRQTLKTTADAPRRRLSPGEALRLLKSPLFVTFLLAAGLVHGSHGMFYTFGVLHWNSLGIPPEWIGTLWAIAIPGEVLLFAYSGAVVRRFGAIPLLIAGATAAVLRWTLMSFDPPLALLFPIQLLHGFTYGAAHLGAMHFISRAVPDHAAGTAQALYATFATGLVIGCVTLASGYVYAAAAGRAYLFVAALACLGLAASLVVLRRWDGGLIFK